MKKNIVEVLEIVKNVAGEFLEKRELSKIKPSTNLVKAGFNSISLVKIFISIEDKFGLELSEDDLDLSQADTPKKISQIVESLKKKRRVGVS